MNDNNRLDVKHRVWIKKCINLALKSNLTHKHGCVMVKNNEIVSSGYNYRIGFKTIKERTNDEFRIVTTSKERGKFAHSVHAEMAAIKGAKKQDLRKCDMYVVRIGPLCYDANNDTKDIVCSHLSLFEPVSTGGGNRCYLKYSHPCESCRRLISNSGIRRVYYSINCI